MTQKGQTLVYILVGVLILVSVAGGAYYFGKSSTPKSSPAPVVTSQTPQPTPDETVYTESDRSANWKTYTNIKYGYSIRYPDDWSLK